MVWFKVDDTLHGHPKLRQVGLAAAGLWLVSGSWAAQYATDGWVPRWFVSGWPHGHRLAAQLVTAGMWDAEDVDGEKGWRFHDWSHYQPTRAEIEADREAARERQRRHRERKREVKKDDVSRVTNGVTNGVSHSTPARPGPSRPAATQQQDAAPRQERTNSNAVLLAAGLGEEDRKAFLAHLRDAGARSPGAVVLSLDASGALTDRIAEWHDAKAKAEKPRPGTGFWAKQVRAGGEA